MRNMLFTLSLLLINNLCSAESILCIPEAGSVVYEERGSFGAGGAEIDKFKFILSDSSGKFVVKKLGEDQGVFDNCITPYVCEYSKGHGGFFIRHGDSGRFSATWMSSIDQLISVMGRCSKL